MNLGKNIGMNLTLEISGGWHGRPVPSLAIGWHSWRLDLVLQVQLLGLGFVWSTLSNFESTFDPRIYSTIVHSGALRIIAFPGTVEISTLMNN